MTWQVIFRHWPLLLSFFEGSLSQSDTQVEILQYNITITGLFEGNCADDGTMHESFKLSHYHPRTLEAFIKKNLYMIEDLFVRCIFLSGLLPVFH
jgi:hypothetical protein